MIDRRRAAEEGAALPDGSFPVETVEDLQLAVVASVRVDPSRRGEVDAHLERRAADLGLSPATLRGLAPLA